MDIFPLVSYTLREVRQIRDEVELATGYRCKGRIGLVEEDKDGGKE